MATSYSSWCYYITQLWTSRCSIYGSIIYQGYGDRLYLTITQVLETNCNFYIESIDLLGAIINFYMDIVIKGMAG